MIYYTSLECIGAYHHLLFYYKECSNPIGREQGHKSVYGRVDQFMALFTVYGQVMTSFDDVMTS